MTKILNYTRFLSAKSRSRQPSAIRALQPLVDIPGMISLGGGMPNPETFPIQSGTLTLKDGTKIDITPERMKVALQYSETLGLKGLVSWVANLQQKVHNPPNPVSVLLSNGSQSLMSMAFDMLVEKDDNVLVEFPTYSGAFSAFRPLGCNLIGIDTDENGLIPSSLRSTLFDLKKAKKPPKVLYTIPTGSNPTGGSMTFERKKEVYKIAQEHDLIIIEDDPYYYLQFSEKSPSLLSLDQDGRVIRLDSFSKIISSGLRLGFATAPSPLIYPLTLDAQASYLHPSGVSQIFLLEVLEKMGVDGFLKHTEKASNFYKGKMQEFQQAAEKHLTGLAEWNTPSAGMFCWIKLLGIDDSFSLIKEKAVEQKVLLVPGSSFSPNDEKSSYVRAAFSTATKEQMDEALRRLAVLLKENASSKSK